MAKAKEVITKITVKLKDARDGVHTAFTAKGAVEFKDGVAEVTGEVAEELKNVGAIE